MNILSKIFVVVLVVLTIALSVAVMVVQRDVLSLKDTNASLRTDIDLKNQAIAAQNATSAANDKTNDSEIDAYKNSTQTLRSQLSDSLKENKSVKGDLLTKDKTIESQGIQITNLQGIVKGSNDEKAALRTELTTANAELLNVKGMYHVINEQFTKAQAEKDFLLKQVKLQGEEIEQLKKRLVEAGSGKSAGGATPAAAAAAPSVRGRVTAVGDGYATVNVGQADSVAPGMRFTVFRGNTFLAELVVTRVEASSAVGRLEMVKASVQVNDNAWTNLEAF